MPKFFNKNFQNVIIYILIFAVGFTLGKLIKNIPYLTLDKEVGIADITNFLMTLIVAVLIPISLSPILKNKRVIKDFLIDETKDCINFLTSIKESIDDMSIKNSADENDRVKVNSMIGPDLGLKISSIAEQLEISFKSTCQSLKTELIEKYNEYWRDMTGGELMSQSFQFNLSFRSIHDKNYAKLQGCLKKAIHQINGF